MQRRLTMVIGSLEDFLSVIADVRLQTELTKQVICMCAGFVNQVCALEQKEED